MNYIIPMVQKLIIFQVDVSNGDLKVAMYTQGVGYVAIALHGNMKKPVELQSKIIFEETFSGVIESEKNIGTEASLENEIWNQLHPLLNSMTDTMKRLLVNICGVQ